MSGSGFAFGQEPTTDPGPQRQRDEPRRRDRIPSRRGPTGYDRPELQAGEDDEKDKDKAPPPRQRAQKSRRPVVHH